MAPAAYAADNAAGPGPGTGTIVAADDAAGPGPGTGIIGAPGLTALPPASPVDVVRPEVTSFPGLSGPPSPEATAVEPETTANDGFDFGDAGIGVAVVAGACALLLAVAAFFVGRRRRLGASHS